MIIFLIILIWTILTYPIFIKTRQNNYKRVGIILLCGPVWTLLYALGYLIFCVILGDVGRK